MAITEKNLFERSSTVEEHQQPVQEQEPTNVQAATQGARRQRTGWQPQPQAVALVLLALGLAHFALIPGFVVDGQRVGWTGQLGDLPLVLTWLLGSLLVAYTVLCYARAACRPLGLPFGPRNWMRRMVKGAVASIITCALLWPGLEPNPLDFAVIPLASTVVLAAWLARRFFRRGPLANVKSRVGAAGQQRSWVGHLATRIGLGGATALAVLVLGIGSWFLLPAWTPPIVDAQGNHVPGSIASLEAVQLGGAKQWILVRGWNTHNPVLLVLPGGPGGSYMGEGARLWGDLEQHFTVVEWDPRGVGKSYAALNPTSKITMAQIVSDTIQLSERLRARFHQQRIYLMGHSGGSIYGVWAVKQRPDLYAAYIGGSQMVNNRLTDQYIYQNLLAHGTKTGDASLLKMLRDYGPPPYWDPKILLTDLRNVTQVGDGLGFKYADMIGEGRSVFEARSQYSKAAEKALAPYVLPLTMAGMSPEYTTVDKVNSIRGLNDVFTLLYPQMQSYDFRRDAPVLQVPVYFMLGEYDANGTSLSVDYFHKLQAPHKELYIFPQASHGEIFEQPERFTDLMVNTVLPETRA